MSQSTTAPSTAPATQPLAVFKPKAGDASRAGTLSLSDGQTLTGQLSTTPEQPVRIWDDEKKEYRDVPFKLIRSMEAKVLWERDEREWKFKASGSDIKEYSGKTYPARETQYIVTLVNGQTITGGIAAPIYLDTPNGQKVFVLHKRDKGEVGQALKDLVYVQKIELSK